MDLWPSLAKLVLSDIELEDSKDLLDVFLGKSLKGRDELVIEATSRTVFRKGDWVQIPSYEGVTKLEEVNIETGNAIDYQLYNLKQDMEQKNNLSKSNSKKLTEMMNAFEAIRGKDYNSIEKIELK